MVPLALSVWGQALAPPVHRHVSEQPMVYPATRRARRERGQRRVVWQRNHVSFRLGTRAPGAAATFAPVVL